MGASSAPDARVLQIRLAEEDFGQHGFTASYLPRWQSHHTSGSSAVA